MRVRSLRRRTIGATALLAVLIGIASGVVRTQQAKLTPSDAASARLFGYVAVAGDTAVVGAAGNASGRGAAYVFTRAGTTWTEQAILTATDGAASDLFGGAVAVAGDTAVSGAYNHNSQRGAAYAFTRTGITWTEQAKLTASDAAANDHFGFSVALAGDTALVGANEKSSLRGAAYVFTRSGATWTQQAKLVPADAADVDLFGVSVALDGDTAIVGAEGKDSFQGVAYVFTRTGTTWTQLAMLVAADAAASDRFGNRVAVAGDTAVVGAPRKVSNQGAAYVFTRTGTNWTQQAKLVPADAANSDLFGASVAVAVAGDAAVVGAYGKSSFRGAAYAFTRTGTTWTEQLQLTPSDAALNDQIGSSVALVGGTAVVGAPNKTGGRGAAYVFDLSGGVAAPPGYCLPTKVKAKVNAAHPEKSTVTVLGLIDREGSCPTFEQATTLDVGGFAFQIPAFFAKGGSLLFAGGGLTLKITPASNGSSRATFSARVVGDLAGKVDLNSPLLIRFKDAACEVTGTVNLAKGSLAPPALASPNLVVLAASSTLKGAGKDSLKLALGFATDGVVPGTAEDLTIAFGGTFTSGVLPAASFVKKGNAWVRTAKAPGITKATVDYAKGTITIAASGLDLGAFAAGGNAVDVTVTRGADVRSVGVRMGLAGTKLTY